MTDSNKTNLYGYQPSVPFINHETEQILNSVSKRLKNRIFSGCYTERSLIETGHLSAYKDIIVVNKSEYEFMKILTTVSDSVKAHFSGRVTLCIAGSENNFSIWTKLSGVVFGSHWFLIKNVTLDKNVINVAVKCLRPINSEPAQSASSVYWDSFSFDSNAVQNMGRSVSQMVTVENLMTSFRFLTVLFLTLLIGSYRMLQLLLKGFHELNYFVQTFTPIVLACIEGITKAFGGLLILIAMMWNNKTGSKKVRNDPPYQYPRHLTYQSNRMIRGANQ